MVKERRSAADALALSPQIEDFITRGITTPSDAAKQSLSIAPKLDKESATLESSKQTPPVSDNSVVDLNDETDSTSEPKFASRNSDRRSSKSSMSFQTTDEMQRLLSKATVQKTVRFQPKLIAQLETWIKRQEAGGDNPPSFQQIQNEALKLWLDKRPA